MSDISMCDCLKCPHKKKCRRSPESGTPVSPHYQSWSMFSKTGDESDPKNCTGWLPVGDKND